MTHRLKAISALWRQELRIADDYLLKTAKKG